MCVGFQVDQFLYESEGSSVLLSCGLGGGEQVQWLKDNKMITDTLNGKVWLPRVSHTHQGEYTCSYKKRQLSYYLIVQGGCGLLIRDRPPIAPPPSSRS